MKSMPVTDASLEMPHWLDAKQRERAMRTVRNLSMGDAVDTVKHLPVRETFDAMRHLPGGAVEAVRNLPAPELPFDTPEWLPLRRKQKSHLKRNVLWGAGILIAAAAAFMVVKRLFMSGYDDDAIDSATEGEFGHRGASAPEQQWAPAQTRTDVSPEQLSMASRLGESAEAIHKAWPAISEEDVITVDGDLDRLADRIAEKVEQPRERVRKRLDEIIARETPRPSYPAH